MRFSRDEVEGEVSLPYLLVQAVARDEWRERHAQINNGIVIIRYGLTLHYHADSLVN